MKRKRIFILLSCIAWPLVNVLLATGARAEIAVTDYLGREVTLVKPAGRIVALAPHIAENLFAAGGGDKMVATVDYSDFPAEAKAIPRVGGYSNFSLESIVAFSPDLVITWASGNGAFGAVIKQLEGLGVAVYIDDPHTLEDVARSIRDFGHLVGNTADAESAARNYLDQLAALRTGYGQRETVSTFYQIWYEPLQTLNGKHIVSDVVRLCGGSNIFSDQPVLAPKVSIESVLERNPSVIVASGMDEVGNQWLAKWQQWPSLTAVQRSQLYSVHPDLLHRHTPRILEGAKQVCEYLEKAREAYDIQ